MKNKRQLHQGGRWFWVWFRGIHDDKLRLHVMIDKVFIGNSLQSHCTMALLFIRMPAFPPDSSTGAKQPAWLKRGHIWTHQGISGGFRVDPPPPPLSLSRSLAPSLSFSLSLSPSPEELSSGTVKPHESLPGSCFYESLPDALKEVKSKARGTVEGAIGAGGMGRTPPTLILLCLWEVGSGGERSDPKMKVLDVGLQFLFQVEVFFDKLLLE